MQSHLAASQSVQQLCAAGSVNLLAFFVCFWGSETLPVLGLNKARQSETSSIPWALRAARCAGVKFPPAPSSAFQTSLLGSEGYLNRLDPTQTCQTGQ